MTRVKNPSTLKSFLTAKISLELELDKIVFDALDLSEDERKEVYRAVCQLVWNRINKANSV